MLLTSSKNKTNQALHVFTTLLIITSLLWFSKHAFAFENESEVIPVLTVSQGMYKKDLNAKIRKEIIKTNNLSTKPDQLNNKATNMSRDAHQKTLINKANKKAKTQYYHQAYLPDFAIYTASSLLQDDFDSDGFYQTFSVVFDADIYSYTQNNLGDIYAQLYISKNGGPWNHYYTTDIFTIEGESELDEYEVITTFLSGYSSDYYDILIDVYQVGYSEVVATYSADDSNALYALSLESADYDEAYVYEETYIEVVEVYGGSFPLFTLIIVFITCVLRCRVKNPKPA